MDRRRFFKAMAGAAAVIGGAAAIEANKPKAVKRRLREVSPTQTYAVSTRTYTTNNTNTDTIEVDYGRSERVDTWGTELVLLKEDFSRMAGDMMANAIQYKRDTGLLRQFDGFASIVAGDAPLQRSRRLPGQMPLRHRRGSQL